MSGSNCSIIDEHTRECLGGMVARTPGLQLRNSYIESFNSGMRHECLHINSFWSWPKPTS